MSIARVTVVRLRETPKFLLGEGKDAKVVETLQWVAQKYNRPCSLTVEHLAACGTVSSAHRSGLSEGWHHITGLFVTKKLALSTCLIWLSWLLIGLAYPLFYVFLPQYLMARGAETDAGSPAAVWRDYFISNVVGIFGPILAGWMCTTRLGRRYAPFMRIRNLLTGQVYDGCGCVGHDGLLLCLYGRSNSCRESCLHLSEYV